jgi:DNA repair exonuclease SbcCD ATPase subunit
MATIKDLEADLERAEQALATAKAQAAMAEPGELGAVDSYLSGLAAKIESLRARLADAREAERQAAAFEAEQAAAAGRQTQIDAFEAHWTAQRGAWAALVAVMEAHEAGMVKAWEEYDRLNADMKELAKEASGLGLQVGNVRETGGALFRRMQRGSSPLRHMLLLAGGVR